MQSTNFVNESWIFHSYPDVSLHWHTGWWVESIRGWSAAGYRRCSEVYSIH